MVAVCQQPNYFPWLGYLEQCARADTLVVLDSVQWIRQGWQHRARILPHVKKAAAAGGASADYQWLTLPVSGHGHRDKPLRELPLAADQDWGREHWNTVKAVYGRRPQFKSQVEPLLHPWFEKQAPRFKTMGEAALSSMQLCLEALELTPELAFSSKLPERGEKTARIVSLCEAVHADVYYSGLASTRYLDHSTFRAAGIRLVWQHWKHPTYAQGRARSKTHLSFIDALANVPLAELRGWLKAPSGFGAGD